jgi:hypothetical protein
MAIARVNTSLNFPNSGADLLSTAKSLTAGNAIIVALCIECASTTTLSTVTDTAGNTYTKLARTNLFSFEDVIFCYALNCTGNASNVVTATFNEALGYGECFTAQYSGVATVSAQDGTVQSNSGNSATASTGSISTANADDVLVAAIKTFSGNDFSAWTNSFTEYTTDGDSDTSGFAERIVSSTGTYSTAATLSTASQWVGSLIALKAASAAAASPSLGAGNGILTGKLPHLRMAQQRFGRRGRIYVPAGIT